MVDLDEFDTPEPDKMDRAIAEGGSVMFDDDEQMDVCYVICPWCKHKYTDGWEWEAGKQHCHQCNAEFWFEEVTHTSYWTKKVQS